VTYKSNEEFLKAYQDLVQRIEDNGQLEVAQRLRKGLSYLNGLTDGWALLMDTIDVAITDNHDVIDPIDMKELEEMFKSVKKVVYRK